MISARQAFARDDDSAQRPHRDFVGYGSTPPHVEWPGGARLALQVVLNYEEGSERSYPMGDGENEGFREFPMVLSGQRDLDVESVYEYGSRAGVWQQREERYGGMHRTGQGSGRITDEARLAETLRLCRAPAG